MLYSGDELKRNSIERTGVNVGYMLVQDIEGNLYRHDPNKPIPEGMIAIVPVMYAGLPRTDFLSKQTKRRNNMIEYTWLDDVQERVREELNETFPSNIQETLRDMNVKSLRKAKEEFRVELIEANCPEDTLRKGKNRMVRNSVTSAHGQVCPVCTRTVREVMTDYFRCHICMKDFRMDYGLSALIEVPEDEKLKEPVPCDWCGEEIEESHISKRTSVGVVFCSPGCKDDWEAHVE